MSPQSPPHRPSIRLQALDALLEPDPALGAAIAALPGRKLILTNAPRAYAERVLRLLGIERLRQAAADWDPVRQPLRPLALPMPPPQ